MTADERRPRRPLGAMSILERLAAWRAQPTPDGPRTYAERWAGRLPGSDDPPDGISPEAWQRHHQRAQDDRGAAA